MKRVRLDRYARFAWGVLVYNLGVILWGAFVRATGSGAGCGSHWPLCNGEVIPRSPGMETIVEFTHRATSGVALLLVVLLVIWARRVYPAGSSVRRGARLSLIFIIIEALLGAGLVVFELVADDASRLRAFSMVAHLVNTFILVAVLALTAWWASGGAPIRVANRRGVAAALGIGLAGLLFVGGTGAIAALGDTLFPADSLSEGLRESFSRDSHPLIQLRKFHPLVAILVGLYVAWLARHLAARIPTRNARLLAGGLTGLYLGQLILGTVNLILLAPIALQLTHLLLADIVWIFAILLGAEVLADREHPVGGHVSGHADRAQRSGGGSAVFLPTDR